MKFNIEIEQETDGRWMAEIGDLPGVMAYGTTRNAAIGAVEALALRVVADRIEHGEVLPAQIEITFQPA
ncbi:MAG: type II toxin-antitoxin system HicB family antitoxin [Candidatus Coatesbacteria bacterium]